MKEYLGVVDCNESLLFLEVLDQGNGSRLASITSIGLECKAEDSDALYERGKIRTAQCDAQQRSQPFQ